MGTARSEASLSHPAAKKHATASTRAPTIASAAWRRTRVRSALPDSASRLPIHNRRYTRWPSARRQADYEDVLRTSDHMVAEVLNGDLYTSARPAGPHAEAASVLGMDLGGAFHRGRGGPGGWIILDEPELHLGRYILSLLTRTVLCILALAPTHGCTFVESECHWVNC